MLRYIIKSSKTVYKKFALLFLIIVASIQFSLSQNPGARKMQITPEVGYQQSDFVWSIAGNANGTNPNVYSELIWNRLRGPRVSLDAKYGISKRFIGFTKISNLFIKKGRARDTDYRSDDRQDAFYDVMLRSDKGKDLALDIGMMYNVINEPKFQLSPAIGYTIRSQNLRLFYTTDIKGEEPLNSKYRPFWQGLLLGVEAVYMPNKMSIGFNTYGRVLDYRAKAQWNLIKEFAQPLSFKHASNGLGVTSNLNMGYQLKENMRLTINGGCSYFKANKGVDILFYNDGREPQETQLNEAKSKSYYISMGVNFIL